MTTDRLAPAIQAPSIDNEAAGPLAALGGIAGLGAVAAASCCVLPLALAAVGAGGAVFSGHELLIAYQPYILGGAVALVAGAWLVFFWRRRRAATCAVDGACARPRTSRRTAVALGLATLSVKLAAVWTFVEPVLLRAVQ